MPKSKYRLNFDPKSIKDMKSLTRLKHMRALVNAETQISATAVLAALSNDVYEGFFSPREPLPPGWIRFKDSSHYNSGYFGACYINTQTNPCQIVIAQRGTCMDLAHLSDDLDIARDIPPLQMADAVNFTEEAMIEAFNYVDRLKGKDQPVSVTFTGHSSGAILSDVASLTIGLDALIGGGIPSITFENPGSKNIIRNLLALSTPALDAATINSILQMMAVSCVSFDADVNMINTCNEQLGSVQRLTNLPYNYQSILEGKFELINVFNVNPLANPTYLQYTLQQHSMDNICNYLMSNGATAPVNQPFGFKQGFGAYLDYPSRKKYWDGLMEKLWSQDDTYKVRDLYENDKSEFIKDFIKHLKTRHDNVLSGNVSTLKAIPRVVHPVPVKVSAPKAIPKVVQVEKVSALPATPKDVPTDKTVTPHGIFSLFKSVYDKSKKDIGDIFHPKITPVQNKPS